MKQTTEHLLSTRRISRLRNRGGLPVLLAAVAVTVLPTTGSRADEAGVPLELGPLAILLPDLAHAAAPAWVKPGLRLVYSTSAATIHPAGTGSIPPLRLSYGRPGKRPAGGWNRLAQAPGGGLVQYDVVAAEGGVVPIAQSTYLIGLDGVRRLSSNSVILGAAGAASDVWVNPTVLKKLEDRSTRELTVTRMAYKALGRQIASVWIKSSTEKGFELHVYEEATGLLVHASAAVQGTPGVFQTSSVLVEERMLKIPWMKEYAIPVRLEGASLRYQGARSRLLSGGFPQSQPLSAEMRVQYHGKTWACFSDTITASNDQGQPPGTSEVRLITGPGQLSSVWIPPNILGALETGQELDRDPITGMVISCSGRQGGMVMITQAEPNQRIQAGYDPETGILAYINRIDSAPPAAMQTELHLVP